MARRNTKKQDKVTIKSENVAIELRKYEKGSLKAFATLTLYGDITIYDCTVVEKKDGDLFLAMPSYEGNDGKYYHRAYLDKDSDIVKEIDELLNTAEDLPF